MSNTIVASVASQPAATGDAYQQHLVYAPNSGVWWFFYLSGTTTLNALYSSDLVTWNTPTGATSTLPANHNNDGRAFSVFVANIASVDVLHIHAFTNTGSAQTSAHVRATVTASTISWGSWADVFTSANSGMTTGTVGCSVAVDSNNKPWFLDNGTTGDANARQATNADTGSAWTAGWGSESRVLTYTNWMGFGKLIALAGGNMLAVTDQGTTGPQLGTMAAAKWTTSWAATSAPFSGTDTNNLNNAGVVKVSNTDVHAVRWTGTALAHARYNATSWSAGDSMTALTGVKTDAGIALASDGTSVWLFVIDSGASNVVKYSQWVSGTGWSAWTTLEASSATRNAVQVHQVPGGTTLAVCWTEGASTPFAIKGSTLSTSGGGVSVTATLAGTATLAASLTIGLLAATWAGAATLTAHLTLGLLALSLAGSGTLAVALTVQLAGLVLAGSGALSASLTLGLLALTLTGAGALAVGLTVGLAPLSLAGSGTLAAVVTVAGSVALMATLTGVAALTAHLTLGMLALTLAGSGTLAAALTVQVAGLVLTGAGTLSAVLTVGLLPLTFTGAAALAAALTVGLIPLTLAGVGALAATVTVSASGIALTATLAGAATLAAHLTVGMLAATFTGTGTLAAVLSVQLAAVTLAGVGALAAALTVQLGSLTLAGAATLAVRLTLGLPALTLTGSGALALVLTVQLAGVVLAGVGSLAATVTASSAVAVVATLAGVAALTVHLTVQLGALTLTGVATLAARLTLGLPPLAWHGLAALAAVVVVFVPSSVPYHTPSGSTGAGGVHLSGSTQSSPVLPDGTLKSLRLSGSTVAG